MKFWLMSSLGIATITVEWKPALAWVTFLNPFLVAADKGALDLGQSEVKMHFSGLSFRSKKQSSELKNLFRSTPLCFVRPAMEVVPSLEQALRFVTFVAVAVRFKPKFDRCLGQLSLPAPAVRAAVTVM
jgi:hypothetical protein